VVLVFIFLFNAKIKNEKRANLLHIDQLTTALEEQKQQSKEVPLLNRQLATLEAQYQNRTEQWEELKALNKARQEKYEELLLQKEQLRVQLTKEQTAAEKAQHYHTEAQEEIKEMNKRFTKEFENIATKY
jgi:hypothetical protein